MTKIDASQGVTHVQNRFSPVNFVLAKPFSSILARVHRDIVRRSIYYRVKRHAFERAEDGEITRTIVFCDAMRRDANDRVK